MVNVVFNLSQFKQRWLWIPVFGLALALFLSLPVLQLWLMDRGYHGRWLDVKAADFQLTSATGERVSLRQFSGGYVYLYFGYLRCDGYCQAQMVTLFLLGQQLIDRPVSLVFITLDPERDTPEQLRGVLDSLALPTFYALLPTSLAQAQNLSNDYQARATREGGWQDKNYTIAHSGEIFLIAPDGKIKLVYSGEHLRADEMRDDFEKLVMQKGES